MKVIDNSPIDVPAVGKLVTENHALGQLDDCCLYVLPTKEKTFADKAREIFEGFLEKDKKYNLNTYDFMVLESMPAMDNHAILKKAIEEVDCDFIMPLFRPSKPDKQYLLVKTDEDRLFTDLGLILYTAERIGEHSVVELMKMYAVEETETFYDDVREAVKSEKFWKNYLASIVSDMFQPTFGMRASLPKIREILKIDGVITHQKKKEMIERMKENIYKYRKDRDKEADAELTYVLNSLDIDSLKMVLAKMSKKQVEMFCHASNPQLLAEESTMKLEIRPFKNIDKTLKTDGRYRLFLHKNMDQIQVHFSRRDSFILYLIYIIDKYKRDEVDSLNIEDHRTQFCKLYQTVYGNSGETQFDSMVNRTNKDGETRQAQIKQCYMDIRYSVSEGCEKLRELPAPFILADAQDHLYVQKSKIILPQKIIDMM